MKKSIVPKIYKFEFYAHKSHWNDDKSEQDCLEELDEMLMYCEQLNQISKVKVTEYSLKTKSHRLL